MLVASSSWTWHVTCSMFEPSLTMWLGFCKFLYLNGSFCMLFDDGDGDGATGAAAVGMVSIGCASIVVL